MAHTQQTIYDPFQRPSQPLLLQVYIHIHSAKVMDIVTEEPTGWINLNQNLYVRYKSFPDGHSQKT